MADLFLNTTPWTAHGPAYQGETKVPWLDSGDIALALAGMRARKESPPEVRLLVEMLEQALGDVGLIRTNRPAIVPELQTEAAEWIWCDEYGWPFSFVSVCDWLGFDAQAIRALVAALGIRRPLIATRVVGRAMEGRR